jgi:hypothetical protein
MKSWLAPLLFASTLLVQPRTLRLPDDAAGVDAIAQALVSVFDQTDIVALGEEHEWKPDSDLRIALVRHPDFAKKVRSIVVEFGSTSHQSTLDRYIGGEDVPRAELEQVWKTTQVGGGGSPISPLVSRRPAMSIRSCLPTREFASSGPRARLAVAGIRPLSPF